VTNSSIGTEKTFQKQNKIMDICKRKWESNKTDKSRCRDEGTAYTIYGEPFL
jgi:hypothetical protein